jgi:SOS-response transcriptional repressor LexA
MKKRPLTDEELLECTRLKAIFVAKKSVLGLSQQSLADKMDMSQSAVSHYLNGRNALNTEVALQFADNLDCRIAEFSPRLARHLERVRWNKTGLGTFVNDQSGTYNVEPAPTPKTTRDAPILDFIQAGAWGDAVDAHPVGVGECGTEPAPENGSVTGFWLRVTGDSMISTNPSRRSVFPGSLIWVDPEAAWDYGDLVVAKVDDDEEATFKQIIKDAGRVYLKALNDAYPFLQVNGNCRVVGKVTEVRQKL